MLFDYIIKPNCAIKSKYIIALNLFRLLKHKITSFDHRVVHLMHNMKTTILGTYSLLIAEYNIKNKYNHKYLDKEYV